MERRIQAFLRPRNSLSVDDRLQSRHEPKERDSSSNNPSVGDCAGCELLEDQRQLILNELVECLHRAEPHLKALFKNDAITCHCCASVGVDVVESAAVGDRVFLDGESFKLLENAIDRSKMGT